MMCAGSSDETLRVWDVSNGTLVTLFDMHAAVADVMVTSDAARVAIRLVAGCHVPVLCVHNSPATAAGSIRCQSQVETHIVGG